MSTSLVKAAAASLAPFGKPTRLSVRQRKRWIEILIGFEAKNSYVVYDESGAPVFEVREEGRGFGNLLKRLFLAGLRPFRSRVEDLSSAQTALVLHRPFRFYFHRLEVRNAAGEVIGAIQRRWTWVRRKYTVEGPDGAEVATLFGPFWRPWTFQILVPGRDTPAGVLQKKWSGLAKELFTEADNFWVEFEQIKDPALRALLFAATVLVDVVHFERS